MRFLEKEELPHFKFQKDFLRPFEYTMTHNANPEIRDMVGFGGYVDGPTHLRPVQVLQCLQQMVQARVQNMRSGWRTMFGVFSAASKVLTGTSKKFSPSVMFSYSFRRRTDNELRIRNCHPVEQGTLCGHRQIRCLCRLDGVHHRLLQSEQIPEDQSPCDRHASRRHSRHARHARM